MTLTLIRKQYRDDGIFGELECGKHYFFTLEHSYDNNPKLPAGEYTCQKGMHQLQDGIRFETFEVMDVPGHWGILFHVGNYNHDSSGCILLGMGLGNTSKKGVMLTSSKQAFKEFMNTLSSLDEFKLVVEDTKA